MGVIARDDGVSRSIEEVALAGLGLSGSLGGGFLAADQPIVPAAVRFGDLGLGEGGSFGSVSLTALDIGQQAAVGVFAEEVAGVEMGFTVGFFWGLCELPVVEAGAEFAGYGLVVLGAVVVTEVVVGEAEGFGEVPAFAVVLGHEGLDAGFGVAAGGVGVALEIGEGDLGQDGVAEFGGLVLVDSPEALASQFGALSAGDGGKGVITVGQEASEVRLVEAVEGGDERIRYGSPADAFAWAQGGGSGGCAVAESPVRQGRRCLLGRGTTGEEQEAWRLSG